MRTLTLYRYPGGNYERIVSKNVDEIRSQALQFWDKSVSKWPRLDVVTWQHVRIVYFAIMLLLSLGMLIARTSEVTDSMNARLAKSHVSSQNAPATPQSPLYSYPHIRVVQGEPMARRIDYSASPYIREASVGAFARYLTIPRQGQTIGDGNYIRSLDQMYATKSEAYGENVDVERLRQHTYSIYRAQRTYMTLGQYARGVDMVINENIAAINWGALCGDLWIRLSASKCQALHRISASIDAQALISVQMTETFSKDTKATTNAWVLDQMYRYQGREAVDANPSLVGRIPVVGPFQITEQLVGESSTRPHPITVVSNYSRHQVPRSIFQFTRNDHERGAHYGYIFDIAQLIRALDDSEVVYLERAFTSRKENMVQFLAASHRGSGDARGFARSWIHDGAQQPLRFFMYTVSDRDYPRYAQAAWRNHIGLGEYITEHFSFR